MIRILAVMWLAILVQVVSFPILMVLGGFIMAANLHAGATSLYRLLRRSRWLILMLLVIFAFATPGEYLAGWPLEFAPTYEGLHAGGVQAIRLAVMLGGIAYLLSTTTRNELISGIYMLLWPISYTGGSPERFAARLWLTLHYVEQQPRTDPWQGWRRFSLASESEPLPVQPMLLDIPRFGAMDWIAFLLMCTVVLWWNLA